MVDIQLLQPKMLLAAIPAFMLLIYLIRKDFVKLPEDEYFQKRKKKWRKWIFISRALIIILLVIALAQPFGEVTKETSGNPRITVLVDNSTSMEMFDTSFLPQFLDRLGARVPLKVRDIGEGGTSNLGDGIMANMEKNTNVLLVTDGHNTEGASLGDVSLFASSNNATISALQMEADRNDVGVAVLGPGKVVEGVNNTYLVRVTKPGVNFYHVEITIDGEVIMDTETNKDVIVLERKFNEHGDHTIRAEVSVQGKDYFGQNNVFHKSVRVVDKPRILYMTEKDSPVEGILRQLYDVEKRSGLPSNLSRYYAVVANDMPAHKFRASDVLSDYLIEGNGLVVFGGFNSFDRGGYKNSVFEQFLPVRVGAAKRTFGDNKVVVSIDRSKGGGKCRVVVDTVTKTKKEVCSEVAYTDVIKSQAVEVINQLDETNQVGAVAFDRGSYLIQPIDHLYNNKQEMINKIKRIQPGGNTLVSKGIEGAYNLLSNEEGSRYIILLTDGVTWEGDRNKAVGLAGSLYQQGVKLITVGIGRSIYEDFLKNAAANGGGFYVSANDKGRLKVLFGDPSDEEQDDNYGLIAINSGHFITRGENPNAVLKGFNQVIPKGSAQMLISTDSGEPALTVWRYGLGKVATWNVFTGSTLGELLNKKNSQLLTKTVNWAIGDPERKKAYFVDIEDGRVGEPLKIRVKANQIPSAEGLNFVKKDQNKYEASITPNQTGFDTILNTKYAVNYPEEYQDTGFSEGLSNIVSSTGGNLFKPDEIERIVEFVRSVSRREVTEKQTIVWPFLLAALVIFLTEVLLRRMSENKMVEERM